MNDTFAFNHSSKYISISFFLATDSNDLRLEIALALLFDTPRAHVSNKKILWGTLEVVV